MKQYIELVKKIKSEGILKGPARKNMPNTLSLFGYQMRFNLQEGFPAITTKKLYWKGVVVELLWFLRGDTNIKFLDKHGVKKMWHQDAYNYYEKLCNRDGLLDIFTFQEFQESIKNNTTRLITLPKNYRLGDCGKQYGYQWRKIKKPTHSDIDDGSLYDNYEEIDQIKNVIHSLKTNPESRRHIVNSWNVLDIDNDDLALPPCHSFFQFNCRKLTLNERKEINEPGRLSWDESQENDEYFNLLNIPQYYLDCNVYLRSGDVFLGIPIDIASYALLTHIIAKICNMVPGELINSFGDVHIYENHFEAVEKQLQNEPKKLPKLVIDSTESFNFQDNDIDWLIQCLGDKVDIMETFKLENYEHCGKIEAELSTGMKN